MEGLHGYGGGGAAEAGACSGVAVQSTGGHGSGSAGDPAAVHAGDLKRRADGQDDTFRFVEQSKALPMGELARRKAATEREIRYKTLSVSPFGLPPLPKGEALVRCKLAAKSEFTTQK